MTSWEYWAIVVVIQIVITVVFTWGWERFHRKPEVPATKFVDPWRMQAELMRISDQHMPAAPVLTKATLLYARLTIEESSELLASLVSVLHRIAASPEAGVSIPQRQLLGDFADEMRRTQITMADWARRAGAQLGHVDPALVVGLERVEAVALLDDTSDIAVVTAGFALATGLPGGRGFLEIAESNFSKRNPETGVIDKDPSGKWIKGEAYFPPDLEAVLATQNLPQ